MGLIFLSCVWVAGIFLGYKLDLPPLLLLLGLVPLTWLFFSRRNWKRIILASLGIFLFIAAALYAFSSLYNVDAGKIHFYNDSGPAQIKGMVTIDPDVRDKSTRLTLSATAISVDNVWRQVSGKVLVFVPRYPEYKYGDVLQLTGELQTPPLLDDFDYRGYLAHQGIFSTMSFPNIDKLDEGKGFKPLAWIYSLRGKLSRTLAGVLPEPQASLAQGILLGMRGNIPADLNQDFVRSGTSHILAISGANISIMAGILLGVGIWLFGRKRYLYIWLAGGHLVLYGHHRPEPTGGARCYHGEHFSGSRSAGAAAQRGSGFNAGSGDNGRRPALRPGRCVFPVELHGHGRADIYLSGLP